MTFTTPEQGRGPAAFALRSRTLGDLLATVLPSRRPLLNGLLREGESMLLWAATGVGKTMAALSMALSIAGAGRFLGWQAPAPRRVLYVDGEMHLSDLRDRLIMLMDAIPGLDREQACRNLVLLARQDQEPTATFPDLCSVEGGDYVVGRALSEGYDLVVLDNLSVLATISDENSASAMDPVLDLLMRLKQAGIATLLLHHSSKGGNNYRGSTKLVTTFEVIIGLKVASGSASRHGTGFDMQFDKFRAARNRTIRPTTAWLEAATDGSMLWRHEEAEDELLARVVAEVSSGRFRTQGEAAEAFGISKGGMSGLKTKAITKGLITADAWQDALRSTDPVAPSRAIHGRCSGSVTAV